MRYYPEKVTHACRGITTNKLRSQGYWIINCTSALKSMILKCVDCRQCRGKVCQQKMGDQPSDRLNQEPPFTYCGIKIFGPFLVKDGRKQGKYGAAFTCMSSRAVHIETINSMSTDSFILALRRLISRKGNVRMIRTDNGTNFVGANIELRKAFIEMNHTKINNFLLEMGGEWITRRRNPPMASNMGEAWNRQICSTRNIFHSLLRTHGESPNDESLRTSLVEAEGILNSRPITCDSIGDVNSYLPVSPMQLLSTKTKMVMPPPGIFQKEDLYCRKQQRHVQHLCDEFWVKMEKRRLCNTGSSTEGEKRLSSCRHCFGM